MYKYHNGKERIHFSRQRRIKTPENALKNFNVLNLYKRLHLKKKVFVV